MEAKPAGRQEQPRERQRPQRPAPRTTEKKVESIEALEQKTEAAAPKEQKAPEEGGQQRTGKRKSRNRRHGHRKPADGGAPAAGGPGSDPKRSEP